MSELTKEDIRNLLVLIAKAQITGAEATPVAVLQQKLAAMANKPVEPTSDAT